MGRLTPPYQTALDYLFARTTGTVRLGLDRTRALLEAIGNPQQQLRALHIAGTNGKGSSVASCAAMLRARGLDVGVYTSPHLIDFRERIVVNGVPIESDRVVAFVDEHGETIERLEASFFEASTALAFLHFAESEVDVAVIETGLGGRLDSTNVINPLVSGVTAIARDHTEYLGETLELIAFEKAGVFKRDRAAVVGEWQAPLRDILEVAALDAGAVPIHSVSHEFEVKDVAVSWNGTRFTLRRFGEPIPIATGLVGAHQTRNTAFAISMLLAGGLIADHEIGAAAAPLADLVLPGRFHRVGRHLFDVAHNPAGIETLCETLDGLPVHEPVTALLGVLSDKEWRPMLERLSESVDEVIVSTPPTAPPGRTWKLDEVRDFARTMSIDVRVEPDFERALAQASDGGGTTVVTGSFHTVGDAMACLQVSPYAV